MLSVLTTHTHKLKTDIVMSQGHVSEECGELMKAFPPDKHPASISLNRGLFENQFKCTPVFFYFYTGSI